MIYNTNLILRYNHVIVHCKVLTASGPHFNGAHLLVILIQLAWAGQQEWWKWHGARVSQDWLLQAACTLFQVLQIRP